MYIVAFILLLLFLYQREKALLVKIESLRQNEIKLIKCIDTYIGVLDSHKHAIETFRLRVARVEKKLAEREW